MSLPGALQGKPLLLYILYCVYTYLHSIVTITILWKSSVWHYRCYVIVQNLSYSVITVPVENLPDVSTEVLMTYLGRISVKWYEFAHALGVGDVAANLQQMEQSPVRKCLQCLEAWIERGPEADCSWEKLLRVLNVLKLHAVAQDILHELRRRASSNTLLL